MIQNNFYYQVSNWLDHWVRSNFPNIEKEELIVTGKGKKNVE